MFHFAVETLQALEVPLGVVPEPDAPPPAGPIAPVPAVRADRELRVLERHRQGPAIARQ